ncbi:MAG: tRNA pseudouridine(38-40) synthase TruA [Lachnospiraceae bacterium]|nr:tRNA pseudouridine(38-40) synthase TruA [Lachnospiraceae bacterium]
MTVRHILIRVAYDGSAYHGWQLQDNGITVEEELNRALSDLFGEEITVDGGSRTDAGVHAKDNVALFSTGSPVRIPAEKLPFALNRRLPADIRVTSGCEVGEDFHPRHCDSVKTYEYRILNSPLQDPLRRHVTTWYHQKLDAERMAEAARVLTGEHDFTSFCSVHAQSTTRVRTIHDIRVSREDDEIRIRVSGNGFLYNMVRIIAGTLMEVGAGRLEASAMQGILEAKDRGAAGPTAPPEGLCLLEYRFGKWEEHHADQLDRKS